MPHADRVEHPAAHHEQSDVNLAGILLFAGGLIVTALLIHLLVWGLFRFFDAREAHQKPAEFPLAIQQENRLPPEPRLQTNPRQDLQDFRAHEDAILTTYGWVDRNAGVVRIPISEAMKLTVERGLPVRQGAGR